MERAGRLIAKWKLCADCVEPAALAKAAWPAAVGKTIAAHSSATGLVRGRLLVEAEDQVWYRQLSGLSRQILLSLAKVLGDGVVTDIEFRLAVPRIQPRREERRLPLLDQRLPDEADGIANPALRRLYKTARRRATA